MPLPLLELHYDAGVIACGPAVSDITAQSVQVVLMLPPDWALHCLGIRHVASFDFKKCGIDYDVVHRKLNMLLYQFVDQLIQQLICSAL